MMKHDGALALVKSKWLGNWYTIEKAEHDGREWFEPTEHGHQFMKSARISDASVEGTLTDMKWLSRAIRERRAEYLKRCAVRVNGEYAFFWSPRNSEHECRVPLKWADDLADQIERAVAEVAGSEE